MEFHYDNLTFRPSTEADLEFILQLENNPENIKFINSWPKQRHREAFRNDDVFHGIVMCQDHPAGFFILAGLESSNKSIEFLRVVIAEKEKGLGRKVLKAVKKYCFEDLKSHRLWLDVKSFNERAKYLYQSEGFQIEGTFRDCLKVGDKYESLTFLSILEAEYRNN